MPINNIHMAAPRLAPPETPNKPGSAKGLWNEAWSKSPITASEPPANVAVAAAGRRVSTTIKWVTTSDVPWLNRASKI